MKSADRKSAKTAWRPDWREVLGSPIHFLAFGFGTGLSPRAPGTVGTLVGIPFWLLLSPLPFSGYCASLVLLFVIGCWLCGASARRLGVHDFGGIVFDEIVGFLITCTPLLPALEPGPINQYLGLLIAFLAFRVFDIAKPWPIGWLDRRIHGGVGIMIDDVVAALFAALVVALALAIQNNPEYW